MPKPNYQRQSQLDIAQAVRFDGKTQEVLVNKGPAHLVYSRVHIDIYQLTYPKQNPGVRQIILGARWYLGWGDGTDYRYQSVF